MLPCRCQEELLGYIMYISSLSMAWLMLHQRAHRSGGCAMRAGLRAAMHCHDALTLSNPYLIPSRRRRSLPKCSQEDTPALQHP